MESMNDLQRLLKRQSEIRDAMRRPGGIRITVERELMAIQEKLKLIPTLAPNGRANGASVRV
jgi:hypothetical protein